ncbi:MAG: hypothetical protein WCJ11_02045 [Methylococcaceae bacterium]
MICGVVVRATVENGDCCVGEGLGCSLVARSLLEIDKQIADAIAEEKAGLMLNYRIKKWKS